MNNLGEVVQYLLERVPVDHDTLVIRQLSPWGHTRREERHHDPPGRDCRLNLQAYPNRRPGMLAGEHHEPWTRRDPIAKLNWKCIAELKLDLVQPDVDTPMAKTACNTSSHRLVGRAMA